MIYVMMSYLNSQLVGELVNLDFFIDEWGLCHCGVWALACGV